MLQGQQHSQWEYCLMGISCIYYSRERNNENWAKLCLQSMETQTPATLPSREKKKILVVEFPRVEDTALQFRELSLKVWEQRPSFVYFQGQHQDNRALLPVGWKAATQTTTLNIEVIQPVLQHNEMAATCCSFRYWGVLPNAEFPQNKSMITASLSFEAVSQIDHQQLSSLFSIGCKNRLHCFQKGFPVWKRCHQT